MTSKSDNYTAATLYRSEQDTIVTDLNASANLVGEWCECSMEFGNCGCERRAESLRRAATLVKALDAKPDEDTPF